MNEQNLKQTLLFESIDSIYQQINTSIKTFWLAFALFLALTWGAFELYKIGLIIFLFFVMYLFRHKAVNAYKNDPHVLQNIKHWEKIIFLISAGSGVTLGLVAFLFYPLHSTNYQIAYFIMMIGVVSGSASVYEHYEPLYRLTIIPVYVGIIANFILFGTLFHLAMAFGITVFFLFMLKTVKNHYLVFRQLSTAQYRNKQLITRLEKQKQQLIQNNQEKAYFIASANHDIRQPVHALNLFIDALSKQNLSEQNNDIIRNMKKSLFILKNYLISLLDIARIDAKSIKVHPIPINLKTLLDEFQLNYSELALENNIVLKTKASHEHINADINIINTVLGHLLTNAFKFARNKKVLLTAKVVNQHIRFRVYDTGCGIQASEQTTIFDDFKRLDHRDDSIKHGLGLGLAISKKMLSLVSGTIHVQSTQGKGSCFSVLIPLSHSNKQTHKANTNLNKNQLKDKLILLIDDDKIVLNAMSYSLKSYGCNVCLAADYNSAITALKGSIPDIIVSDYRLEHEDGINVIEKINAFYDTKINSLIVTADTSDDIEKQLNDKNIPVYLKPLQTEQLLHAIQQF